MEAVKEAIKSQNGATPADDVMAQIAALLQAAGYDGLGVGAVAPKTGEIISVMNFLPDGWLPRLVPIKKDNG